MKTFKQFIKESEINILYHFINKENLLKKIKNNFKFKGRTFGAVSFTKSYTDKDIMIFDVIARIVIDAKKLSKVYELKDFKFYNSTPRNQKPSDEKEVRIITKGDKDIDLSPYIKQIDIIDFETSDEVELIDLLKKKTKYKINLVDDWKKIK